MNFDTNAANICFSHKWTSVESSSPSDSMAPILRILSIVTFAFASGCFLFALVSPFRAFFETRPRGVMNKKVIDA